MTKEQANTTYYWHKSGKNFAQIGYMFKDQYKEFPFAASSSKLHSCRDEENGKRCVEEADLILNFKKYEKLRIL